MLNPSQGIEMPAISTIFVRCYWRVLMKLMQITTFPKSRCMPPKQQQSHKIAHCHLVTVSIGTKPIANMLGRRMQPLYVGMCVCVWVRKDKQIIPWIIIYFEVKRVLHAIYHLSTFHIFRVNWNFAYLKQLNVLRGVITYSTYRRRWIDSKPLQLKRQPPFVLQVYTIRMPNKVYIKY